MSQHFIYFQRIQHPLLVSLGISSVCDGHYKYADTHTCTLKLNKYFKSPPFFLYNTSQHSIGHYSYIALSLPAVCFVWCLSLSGFSHTTLFIDSVILCCRLQLPPSSELGWAISLLSRPEEGSRESSLRGFSFLHIHITENFFLLTLLGEVWYCWPGGSCWFLSPLTFCSFFKWTYSVITRPSTLKWGDYMWEQVKHCHRFLIIKVILKKGPSFQSKYFHIHLPKWHAFFQSYLLHQPRRYILKRNLDFRHEWSFIWSHWTSLYLEITLYCKVFKIVFL